MSVVALEPKTQIAGVTVIADCNGFGYRHFKSLSFDDIRIISNFIQVSQFHFRIMRECNEIDLNFSTDFPFGSGKSTFAKPGDSSTCSLLF